MPVNPNVKTIEDVRRAIVELQKQENITPNTFVSLTDTPETYTGHDGEVVYVNGSVLDFGQVNANQVAGDGATNVLANNCVSESNVTQHEAALQPANMDATGITDGYILTADGANGCGWEAPAATVESIDDLNDVDTTTDAPVRDEVLKWNGSNWVPAAYNATFEFTIASFTDNQAATIEIGSGTWKAAGALTFDMTYNNGPPDSGYIQIGGTGGVTWSGGNLVLSSPFATANSASDTAYPASKDTTITFTLNCTSGADNDTDVQTVTFRNQVRYGKSSVSTGWSSAQIVALAGATLTNDNTQNIWGTISGVGASDYIIFACPASYTNLSSVNFSYGGLVLAVQSAETISVTNSSGFTENYEVYRSTLQNLGSQALRTDHTSAQNYFYYGGSTVASSYSEANIEGLTDVQTPITNDQTQTWNTVTLGASEYFVFAYPSRLTDPSFWYDHATGFALALYGSSPETVSITNPNGYTENYDVWRSENILGPGDFTLRTA